MKTDPVRFIILDHSTAKAQLVEIISCRHGQRYALVNCGVHDASLELWRETGVHQRNHLIIKVNGSDRKKLDAFGSSRSYAYPHAVGPEIKLAFMNDVFDTL